MPSDMDRMIGPSVGRFQTVAEVSFILRLFPNHLTRESESKCIEHKVVEKVGNNSMQGMGYLIRNSPRSREDITVVRLRKVNKLRSL